MILGEAWDWVSWGTGLPVDGNLGTAGKGRRRRADGSGRAQRKNGGQLGLAVGFQGELLRVTATRAGAIPSRSGSLPLVVACPEADNAPAISTLAAAWRARPDRNDGKL